MIRYTVGLIFIFLLVLSSCKRNPLAIDPVDYSPKIEYINLDSFLFESSIAILKLKHTDNLKTWGGAYEYALGMCLQVPDPSDSALVRTLSDLKVNPFFIKTEQAISSKFPNLSVYSDSISTGFSFLRAHFPSCKVPKRVFFANSWFWSNTFSTEDALVIGLERYLGSNSAVIKQLPQEPFYDWMKLKMEARYLTRDVFCNWVLTHVVKEVDGNLAEQIVNWGKVLYATHAALPHADPSVILRYTTKEYAWAVENERNFWEYLVEQKFLFKVNEKNTLNFLSDGPFTPGLPDDKAPDRLGQFIGYQMIKTYLGANDQLTLKDVISLPYTEILTEYEID